MIVRPTSVRSRPYAGNVIALEVLGLKSAERVPVELRAAYLKMLARLEEELVISYRSFVPGGPNGHLGRQVGAKRLASGRIVVGTFGSRFARALNRGFTAPSARFRASHPNRVLHLNTPGGPEYVRRVVVRGRHFHEKALAAAPAVVEANYARWFFNIKDGKA